MIREVSIWLTLIEEDENYLSAIIKRLAKQYDSPVFRPHLTLCNPLEINIAIIDDILNRKLSSTTKPIKLKASGIEHSAEFFKAVFINMEEDQHLLYLRQQLCENNLLSKSHSFKPHISLIYKNLTKEIREKITESIYVKSCFIFDKISIISPTNKLIGWKDVNSWELVSEFLLNDSKRITPVKIIKH